MKLARDFPGGEAVGEVMAEVMGADGAFRGGGEVVTTVGEFDPACGIGDAGEVADNLFDFAG